MNSGVVGAFAGRMTVMALVVMLVSLVITFAPSILAVLRGNIYKGQVIKYQLLVTAVSIAWSLVGGLLTAVLPGKLFMMIVSLISGVWGLAALVLWFYILINAWRDTEMTLLSRFGINI